LNNKSNNYDIVFGKFYKTMTFIKVMIMNYLYFLVKISNFFYRYSN